MLDYPYRSKNRHSCARPRIFLKSIYLLITHDHWDHLDYPTVMGLKDKIGKIITPLGVGSYFRQWGFDEKLIHEGDWNDVFKDKQTQIHILPARHFSGRLLTRNKTLWGIICPDHPESPHLSRWRQRLRSAFPGNLKNRFSGGFDLAILECGQYNPDWRLIHMSPEETAQAAADLSAKHCYLRITANSNLRTTPGTIH